MSKAHLLAACMIGSAALLLASECQAQGNIDRGKTPAQAFADTCAACHRSPRALKRTSAAFLRQHYSVSSAEASAMAAYLAGFPTEPVHQAKRPPVSGPEARAEAVKQQPKQQPGTVEKPQTASSQPGSEHPNDVTDVNPAAPVADLSLALAPPPGAVLEAFEE
jgi:hypothetical protein